MTVFIKMLGVVVGLQSLFRSFQPREVTEKSLDVFCTFLVLVHWEWKQILQLYCGSFTRFECHAMQDHQEQVEQVLPWDSKRLNKHQNGLHGDKSLDPDPDVGNEKREEYLDAQIQCSKKKRKKKQLTKHITASSIGCNYGKW